MEVLVQAERSPTAGDASMGYGGVDGGVRP